MTTKELIRKKFADLYMEYKEKFHQTGDSYFLGIIDGLDMTNRVLNTMPDEPVTDCNDLMEEAAEDHIRKVVNAAGHPGWDWETRDIEDAFIAGAEWMKAKTMDGAVEGEVCILPGYVAYVKEKNNESLKQYLLDNFKTGDEVSIIILPKE